MILLALALLPAHAGEVTIRNDTAYDDTFDTSDQVAWLEYPECAVSVFSAADYTLPMTIDTVDIFLGASDTGLDGETTYVEVSIKTMTAGDTPSIGDFSWGTDAFQAVVSTSSLNEFSLDDPDNGWVPMDWTEGDLAIFVCPTDPASGDSWPGDGGDPTSGLIIDTGSPSTGNWL